MEGDASVVVIIIIIDLPEGASAEAVRALRRTNPQSVIVLMHGTCTGRIEADVIVSPSRGFRTRRHGKVFVASVMKGRHTLFWIRLFRESRGV